MHLRGKCACGKVTFEANGEPLAQLYCHCRSCQMAHTAPVVAAAVFPASSGTYQGDVRKVTVSGREDAARRVTCTNCGTKVVNEPVFPIRTVFPALCETADWFKPQMHIQWNDHTLDVRDDLPKFLDYPKELGGTGNMA